MNQRRQGKIGFALFSAVAGVALTLWATACGSHPNAADDGLLEGTPVGPTCATPNEGCPCDEPGKIVDCGQVKHRSGDQVSCSMGKRSCNGGSWGACEGDHFITTRAFITTPAAPLGGSLTPAALGTSAACSDNPCDPYCNNIVDTPGGGVTLPVGGGPPQCKAPTSWSAYYALYTGTTLPNGVLPTTCTAAPDNCSNDNVCTAGACVPRAISSSGSCVGVDFTLSTPCYDGTDYTFQVCNRGTVTADTGILPIAHNAGAPSVAASTGTRAVNGAVGQCNVNLAITPLAPGQCRQVTPRTDCGIDTSAGVHAFYVNFANTPAVLTTPSLAECNTTNNYTATINTAAAVAGAACTPASCGTSAPSGGQFPPNFSSTDGTNQGCAGATDDFVGGSCSAAPGAYSNCAQDFHCDAATDRCKWNVTGNWVDPTCAGVDLTVGVGCEDAVNAYHLPVCNRGMGTLAAGSTIAVNITTNSWTPAVACSPNVGAYHCGLTLTQPLVSGQCVDIPGCTGGVGQRELIVNPSGTIPECTLCNNWSHVKTTGAGCQVMCTVPPPPNVQIYGHSANRLYRIDPVTYSVTLVGTMSGCGTVFDLAIDATGKMYSVNSASQLHRVTYPLTGTGTVSCAFLSNNPTSFNGLTFTPTSLLTPVPAEEPLHGQANNGGWYKITLTAGGAPVSYALGGYYGGTANKIESSGDAVGIVGDGEYAVVKSGTTSLPGGDHLWKVDPNNGSKITDITPTGSGLGACYGIAYWGGKTYLFCASPSSGIYTIDTVNGATNLVKATPTIAWNGAAVTTTAPTLPPTPPVTAPPVQYFTRDYQATCPPSTRLVWSFFKWQADVPAGTIDFFAQTAATAAAFGAPNAAPSAMPPAVPVGSATVTTGAIWYADANTVDWHLRTDPPANQQSQEHLRITMKFNASGGTVPSLTTWKQEYSCVPAE